MTDDSPFRFIESILETKRYLLDSDDEVRQYNAFFTNRALSQHLDTIFHVNAMNVNGHIPPKMSYDYLFNTVRKMKRQRRKWPKRIVDDKLQLIMDYYGLSYNKAKAASKLVTDDQIKKMKAGMEVGG